MEKDMRIQAESCLVRHQTQRGMRARRAIGERPAASAPVVKKPKETSVAVTAALPGSVIVSLDRCTRIGDPATVIAKLESERICG